LHSSGLTVLFHSSDSYVLIVIHLSAASVGPSRQLLNLLFITVNSQYVHESSSCPSQKKYVSARVELIPILNDFSVFLKELVTSVYIARRQTVDYRVAFLYASIEPTRLKQPFRRLRSFGDFNACVRHELMPILSENFAMFFKELVTSVYIARRQTVDY
jgi:hypothetical protein